MALEAVRIGEIEARDASTDLILDAEILVDDAELAKIKNLPEIKQALSDVPVPAPQFGTTERNRGDWRAKGSEMRKLQWKQKPVIDYIAGTYKPAIFKAVAEKLASIPEQWRNALMTNPTYRLETKGLQLSPTADKSMKSVFVQVVLGLGSYEGDGFLGKIAQEFEQALAGGQVQEAADGLVWKSSLTGLDTLFKSLDPFAGHKESEHKIHGHDVARWAKIEDDPSAAEPGYDLHVKEALLDQIQNTMDQKLVEAMSTGVESIQVSDDGVFVIKALAPEPATDQERMADDVEEPPPAEPTDL